MLKRDASGIITASPSEHDIIGWTTDEILRTFMDVDEPTDQLTIDRRERLLELRRRDSLTAEEEAEMGELRRHVNEDFLSSSTPLESSTGTLRGHDAGVSAFPTVRAIAGRQLGPDAVDRPGAGASRCGWACPSVYARVGGLLPP